MHCGKRSCLLLLALIAVPPIMLYIAPERLTHVNPLSALPWTHTADMGNKVSIDVFDRTDEADGTPTSDDQHDKVQMLQSKVIVHSDTLIPDDNGAGILLDSQTFSATPVPTAPPINGTNSTPPAPPAPGTFSKVSGDCTVVNSGTCVQSPRYPSIYSIYQSCVINAAAGLITTADFNTEGYFDKLFVNGQAYSGTRGPPTQAVTSQITWTSDGSVARKGWQLCKASAPTAPPATPVPTAPPSNGTNGTNGTAPAPPPAAPAPASVPTAPPATPVPTAPPSTVPATAPPAVGELRINFQNVATTVPQGWLADYGLQYAPRGNGYTYGWFCGDSPTYHSTTQTRNRQTSGFSDLLNTLVVPDRLSNCANEHWNIAVPNGDYLVEIVFQDTTYVTNTRGCSMEGHSLSVGDVPVHGTTVVRNVSVRDGNLTFAGSWANQCGSINRLVIKASVPTAPPSNGTNGTNGTHPAPTPAAPAPSPAPGSFSKVSGDCTIVNSGTCVQSPRYPSAYSNSQSCVINPAAGLITSVDFNTETYWDKLFVNGRAYNGTRGPPTQAVTSQITWTSDGSVARKGWQLCKAPAPTAPPATPVPTSPPGNGTNGTNGTWGTLNLVETIADNIHRDEGPKLHSKIQPPSRRLRGGPLLVVEDV